MATANWPIQSPKPPQCSVAGTARLENFCGKAGWRSCLASEKLSSRARHSNTLSTATASGHKQHKFSQTNNSKLTTTKTMTPTKIPNVEGEAPTVPPTPEPAKMKCFHTPPDEPKDSVYTPTHPAAGGYPGEGWPKSSANDNTPKL